MLRNEIWINTVEILIHVLSIKGASVLLKLLSSQMWTGCVFLDCKVMSQNLSMALEVQHKCKINIALCPHFFIQSGTAGGGNPFQVNLVKRW